MASNQLFSIELKKKLQHALSALNALNSKIPQQIISILKIHTDIDVVDIANYVGSTQSSVEIHLDSLLSARILTKTEKADQAFFSLNEERMAKIASVVNRLAQ